MNDSFIHSYLPHTDEQRQEMLTAIGLQSMEDLFRDIPSRFRDPSLNLAPQLSELELREELDQLARRNIVPGGYACFLGGGAYRHFIPSVVQR